MRRSLRFWAGLAVAATLSAAAPSGFFPAIAPAAEAATISTVVENVAVDVAGDGTLTIRRIEVAGKGSSGADLIALFDRANPQPLADRLRAFDAPSIVMPEVIAEYPLGDIKVRKVYRDVRLVEVVRGRIGAVSVGKIDIALSKPPRPSIRGSIGGMMARNVDLVLLARLFTSPRAVGGEVPAPLFDYVTLKDIEMDVPRELHVAVERISASRLTGRALAVPLAELPARLEAIDRASQSRAEREKAAVLIGKDMLESFALGAFELRGLQVTLPRGPLAYRVDRIAVADVAQPRIGDIAVEGVSFNGADADTSIGMIDLRGFDFHQALERVAALVRRSGPDERGMDVRSMVVGFDRLLVEHVAVTPRLPGPPPEGAPAVEPLFRVDRMELTAANPTNAIPGSLYGRVDGLAVSTRLSARDDPLGILGQMGYRSLALTSGRFDLAWNQATGEIVLDKLIADMPDIGAMEIAATATGASVDLFSAEPAVEQAAALGLRARQVDVVVHNAGVVEKLLALIARQKGTSVDTAREKLVRDAATELPEQLGGGRAARALGDALGRFVTQPRSLHVSVVSAGGLGFAELPLLRSPADLLDRMDVSATANQ